MAYVINRVGASGSGSVANILVTGLVQSGNTVTAVTPSGGSKSAVWGSLEIEGTTTYGWLLSSLDEYGTYTITATDGTQTATATCLVDVATDYEVEMSYE